MNPHKTFAIICAAGIGDALLMQIAAHHLRRLGHTTVTFSNHLEPLSSWFPGFSFAKQPPLEQIAQILDPFDAIVLQHDNSAKARAIHALSKRIYTFYGTHSLSKHGALKSSCDAIFNPQLCMADNIVEACNALFPGVAVLKSNGLIAPSPLSFCKYPTRIAIHPTSTSADKNWSKRSFLQLRERLAKEGWSPRFVAPPEEAAEWGAPLLPRLADLAAFLYESGAFIGNDSGPGHLASNLGLPTVVIGPSEKHLSLWRPGWRGGEIAHPPSWIGNLKIVRKNWQFFVSVNQVFKTFMKLSVLK